MYHWQDFVRLGGGVGVRNGGLCCNWCKRKSFPCGGPLS